MVYLMEKISDKRANHKSLYITTIDIYLYIVYLFKSGIFLSQYNVANQSLIALSPKLRQFNCIEKKKET